MVWTEAIRGYEKLWEVLEAARCFQAFLPGPVALLPLHSSELLSTVFSPFSHTPLLTRGSDSIPPLSHCKFCPMAEAAEGRGRQAGDLLWESATLAHPRCLAAGAQSAALHCLAWVPHSPGCWLVTSYSGPVTEGQTTLQIPVSFPTTSATSSNAVIW